MVKNYCWEINTTSDRGNLLLLEEDRMSKKSMVAVSVILLVLLVALMVCERMNPTGGQVLLQSIF